MSLRTLMISCVALVALGLGGTLALAPWNGTPPSHAQNAPEPAALAVAPTPERVVPEGQGQVQLSFAPIVQTVSPSVVPPASSSRRFRPSPVTRSFPVSSGRASSRPARANPARLVQA